MILYHGSSVGGIDRLEPRQADHDWPYVYLTDNPVVAAFYTACPVPRPYYFFPYGFDGEGHVTYDECWPGALREIYGGKRGYLYTVEADESRLKPFGQIPGAYLAVEPVAVTGCREIEDIYDWLMDEAEKGRLLLHPYETMSDRMKAWLHKSWVDELKELKMIEKPGDPYAAFIREKFPEAWAEYENACK